MTMLGSKRNFVALVVIVATLSFALSFWSYIRRATTPPEFNTISMEIANPPELPEAYLAEFTFSGRISHQELLLHRTFLVKRNEPVIVYLGDYGKLVSVESWEYESQKIMVLVLEKGNRGRALSFRPGEDLEVYAFFAVDNKSLIIPLFKVVEENRLIEVRGRIKGLNISRIEVYGYPDKSLFNSSLGPSDKDKVAEYKVPDYGSFRFRIDVETIPLFVRDSRRVSNNYLLVYASSCEGGYYWIDLSRDKGKTIEVSFSCEG